MRAVSWYAHVCVHIYVSFTWARAAGATWSCARASVPREPDGGPVSGGWPRAHGRRPRCNPPRGYRSCRLWCPYRGRPDSVVVTFVVRLMQRWWQKISVSLWGLSGGYGRLWWVSLIVAGGESCARRKISLCVWGIRRCVKLIIF